MDNVTRINQEINRKTRINPSIDSGQTQINPAAVESTDTVLNPALTELTASNQLQEGFVLLDRYVIENKLNVSTGEADIYVCSCKKKKYIAKIYRRDTAIKQEVIDAIQRLESPYVAKISEVGLFKGRTVEILPYYSKGSISGKTFDVRHIKSLVSCMNEALHALHQIGIIHKDLKPSNIMLWDNERGYSVIDFGISSITRDGQTVLVTKTGMTPEYSAPETHHNLFLEESDYYSLGITVYELFCGHTPYSNMTMEEIAQYTLIQQFPFPNDMPESLVSLIKGLTYADITHRNEPGNPNRRWTYNEVLDWCEGKKVPVPGETSSGTFTGMRPYPFMGNKYNDMPSLVRALAENWDAGKKQLYRGTLSGYFKAYDPEIADMCMDTEDAAAKNRSGEDYYFFDLLYKLDPDLNYFYWKKVFYISLPSMGRNILYKLRMCNLDETFAWHEILGQKVVSCYLNHHATSRRNLRESVELLEKQHNAAGRSSRDLMLDYYLLGYLLSRERELYVFDRFYTDVPSLNETLSWFAKNSMARFEESGRSLIDSASEELDPQLEAWLYILGKGRTVDAWRKGN